MYKSRTKDLIKAFIMSGIPIINIGECSGNRRYKEKISFNDSRFYTKDEEPEFAVEVFENEKKLKIRKDELQKISDQVSVMFLKSYFISFNTVLLRLPYRLTLDAILEYRKAFELHEKGDKSTGSSEKEVREMEKGIQATKFALSSVISIAVLLLGGNDNILTLLFYLIIADFVLGSLKAIKEKQYDSSIARWGAVNKALEIVLVIIFNHCDKVFSVDLFRNGAIIWFCICEGGSMVENLISLGMPLPDDIKDIFAQVKKGTSINFINVLKKTIKEMERSENGK